MIYPPTTQQLSNPSTTLPDDVVLSVRNVSKKFCRNLKRSMAYGIKDLACNLVGVKQDTTQTRNHEFWALNDINFDLKRGEILGIIGRNGSGKTTLLRILTGIFPPDKGEISIRGRVTSLIALGAGFHPHMTGRENVYLNGTILGMTGREIQSKFDEIAKFAEIGEFIDAPVATYSSGMRVRLGFSVAIHLDPNLLFIDEVLAVGDQAFKRKAEEKIKNLILSGISVLFVSHNLTQVARMCHKVMLLERGVVKEVGEAEEVVGAYMLESEPDFECTALDNAETIMGRAQVAKWDDIVVERVEILESRDHDACVFETYDNVTVRVHYTAKRSIQKASFQLHLSTKDGTKVGRLASGQEMRRDLAPGCGIASVVVSEIPLRRQTYSLGLIIGDQHGIIFWSPHLTDFKVEASQASVGEIYDQSIVDFRQQWSIAP